MKNKRRGIFTLEVLMAIAVVALALVPVVTSMVEGYRQTSFTEDHLTAQARAQRLMDLTLARRSLLFRGAFPAGSWIPEEVPDPGRLPDRVSAAAFTLSWKWQAVAGTTDLLRVSVRVAWQPPSLGPALPPRELSLVRLVARPDAGLYPVLPLAPAGGFAD